MSYESLQRSFTSHKEHRQEDDIRAEVLANAVVQGEKRQRTIQE